MFQQQLGLFRFQHSFQELFIDSSLGDLRQAAYRAGFADAGQAIDRQQLALAVMRHEAESHDLIWRAGILQITPEGHGFLRGPSLMPAPDDVRVADTQIHRLGLRSGDEVWLAARPPRPNERYIGAVRVACVNGLDPEGHELQSRKSWEEIQLYFPTRLFNLEPRPNEVGVLRALCGAWEEREIQDMLLCGKAVNLFAPIGPGTGGLVTGQSKSGKTTTLAFIASLLRFCNPETLVIYCTIDERLVEITWVQSHVLADRVFVAANTDPPEVQRDIADLTLAFGKQQALSGRDVIVVFDSAPRYTRAAGLDPRVPTNTGLMSGGLNPQALLLTRQLAGAYGSIVTGRSGKKVETAGSLTLLLAFLEVPGDRQNETMHRELRGTGIFDLSVSLELNQTHQCRPPIDPRASGIRRADLIPELAQPGIDTALRKMREEVLRGTDRVRHPGQAWAPLASNLIPFYQELVKAPSSWEFLKKRYSA